jgi:nicotinate-nucleotide--dimethylbenzimidazole phosphoribosyltransferase
MMSLLETTIKDIVGQDSSFRARATERLDQLTMPHWALGRLMDLAVDLAGMTRSLHPPVERRVVVTMAADHGVALECVSKYPQEVTAQMVHNFVNGGAGINALARTAGADVVVVDMGVKVDLGELAKQGKIISKRIAPGTRNMATGPAMTREEAIRTIEAGIEIARELGQSFDVLGTGEMGIGNTTPAGAIASVFTGNPAAQVTGRGTGVDDDQLAHKVCVIEKSLQANQPDAADALDVLSKVGGFEIGGIAGLVLGAAAMKKPVVLDGFPATAGGLIAHSLAPLSAEYMIAAHRSVEPGHRIMHDHLGKSPLFDLDLRLGEGTGAALAMNLVDAAVRILTEVATFGEAGVSEADK